MTETDHASPQRAKSQPDTKFIFTLPNFITQFWRPRSGFSPEERFWRTFPFLYNQNKLN